ncbi:MAG: 3'-5' exoribonuclease YhaM family protein [Turicibacter sp.]
MQIKDLVVKSTVTVDLMIKAVSQGLTTSRKPYLKLEFMDNSGTIFANKWTVTPEELTLFNSGQIVTVKGVVQLYHAQKQLNVETMALKEGEVDYSLFVESSKYPVETLRGHIKSYLDEMSLGYYKAITEAFITEYGDKFYVHPAASRMHHHFKSGLVQHVFEMLKMASQYCDLYPTLNRDLVYAGIVMHDMGKLFEMECTNFINTEYTIEGTLIGHISIMVSLIDEKSKELGFEGQEIMLLKHMVLSHHGKLEWGSPKEPLIIEAELVHYLDVVSAKLTALEMHLEQCEVGNMTERIGMLENRRFYKHQ